MPASTALVMVGLVTVVTTIVTISRQPSLLPIGGAEIVVYKTPTCGCCNLWVEHLRDNALVVSAVNTQGTRSDQVSEG
jgi:hypothetical protein